MPKDRTTGQEAREPERGLHHGGKCSSDVVASVKSREFVDTSRATAVDRTKTCETSPDQATREHAVGIGSGSGRGNERQPPAECLKEPSLRDLPVHDNVLETPRSAFAAGGSPVEYVARTAKVLLSTCQSVSTRSGEMNAGVFHRRRSLLLTMTVGVLLLNLKSQKAR